MHSQPESSLSWRRCFRFCYLTFFYKLAHLPISIISFPMSQLASHRPLVIDRHKVYRDTPRLYITTRVQVLALVMKPAVPIQSDRVLPCRILREKGIACTVWFEDALAHYGVPTVLFDLYLLVPDLHIAVQELLGHGWTRTSRRAKVGNADVKKAMFSLAPPISDREQRRVENGIEIWISVPTTTVLLSSNDWNYALPKEDEISRDAATFFPPLPRLLEALMDSMLDTPPEDSSLRIHLVCQISYLYDHVAETRQPAFAGLLSSHHRQYHFDVLAGMNSGTIQFQAHQRMIRDAIRQGTYEVRECSASYENEDLFTARQEAKLLKSMLSRASSQRRRAR